MVLYSLAIDFYSAAKYHLPQCHRFQIVSKCYTAAIELFIIISCQTIIFATAVGVSADSANLDQTSYQVPLLLTTVCVVLMLGTWIEVVCMTPGA